jgi:hypothetical protein
VRALLRQQRDEVNVGMNECWILPFSDVFTTSPFRLHVPRVSWLHANKTPLEREGEQWGRTDDSLGIVQAGPAWCGWVNRDAQSQR